MNSLVLRGEPQSHGEAVAASQMRAKTSYPEIAVAGSPLNSRFVSEWRRLQAVNDPLLGNDDWPMILARRCAEDLGLQSPRQPSADSPPATPLGQPPSATATPIANAAPTQAEIRAVEKYKVHVLAKIIIFRPDGMIARVRQMWNRAIVDASGRETGKVYPDKYLIEDAAANSVFIEGPAPPNVATGEETELYVYPCGMLEEHSTRYRKFTTSARSVIDYINAGGTPPLPAKAP